MRFAREWFEHTRKGFVLKRSGVVSVKRRKFISTGMRGGRILPPLSFRLTETARQGFSILEIIISLLLLGIGILAIGQGYKAGRIFLRQSDNRSVAISIASKKMEEYLAKTYDFLDEDESPYTGREETEDKRIFDWRVDVEKRWEGEDDPGTLEREGIPYKNIIVRCSYQDRNIGGRVEDNEVRMVNIVPYPSIHTETVNVPPDQEPLDEATAPRAPQNPARTVIISRDFEYETDKDLTIVYNITTKVINAAGIGPLDTIYTECRLDGEIKHIVTRTPIIMQPLISNVIGVEKVKGDRPHTIEVRWYKDTASGEVILKEANLVIMAIEHR